jgi:hypothetical protein
MFETAGLFLAFRLTWLGCRALWWIVATAWLGVTSIITLIRLLPRLRLLQAETLPCPRGHEVDAFGVYECHGCKARYEGHVFAKCPHCHSGAGWTPCPECTLPVSHPVPELVR